MVCDTARLLNQAMRAGKKRAVRRRAGHHAGYRSRHLSVRDVLERQRRRSLHRRPALPPTRIDGIIGVSKAYITRVGGGPFPTEDSAKRAS